MKLHNYRVVNRKRFFTSSFLILLITLTILISGLCVNANSKEKYNFTDVYVQTGDSLWTLSEKVNNTDLEIRDYIDNVISINNLNGGSIMPGQLLHFPISK